MCGREQCVRARREGECECVRCGGLCVCAIRTPISPNCSLSSSVKFEAVPAVRTV